MRFEGHEARLVEGMGNSLPNSVTDMVMSRLDREIVAGNRDRWEWTGPEDPEVETILEAYEAGELDEDKKEKLQALKDKKAKQRAEAKAAAEAEETEVEDDEEIVEGD